MIGLVIAEQVTAPIEFRCLGFDHLRSQLQSFLHPMGDREYLVSLLTPKIESEQASMPVERSLREIVDSIAARAIASEADGVIGADTNSDQSETEDDEHKIEVRNKMEFAGDVISTIFKGHVFITSSMSVPTLDLVDPFVGMNELESVLSIRAEEPELIVQTKGGTKGTGKGKGRVKVKIKGKGTKASTSKRGVTQKESIEVGSPTGLVGSDDYDFFLFLAPYIIPCELLTRMIREGQRKAKTVRKLS
jgi:hypothetical protein